MTTLLTLTVALLANFTGSTCAAIDNTANQAAWAHPGQPPVATTYRDMDRIIYATAPGPADDEAWVALHNTEKTLQVGEPGPKLHVTCS